MYESVCMYQNLDRKTEQSCVRLTTGTISFRYSMGWIRVCGGSARRVHVYMCVYHMCVRVYVKFSKNFFKFIDQKDGAVLLYC